MSGQMHRLRLRSGLSVAGLAILSALGASCHVAPDLTGAIGQMCAGAIIDAQARSDQRAVDSAALWCLYVLNKD